MRERTATASRSTSPRGAFTVDVALLTPLGQQLGVLALRSNRPRARDAVVLPWDTPRAGEALADTAHRLLRTHIGTVPMWVEQVAAFADAKRHPSGAALSVCFAAVMPGSAVRPEGPAEWLDVDGIAALPDRQRQMVAAAQHAIRRRMDYEPIPFRLLPPHFTLSELQHIYEVLLGRRLHKASFRRALHASWLVEPTDHWRSEGRGRPAQLFRYAPRRRRGHRRGVRFDLL
ncbi:MAG TPA: hypothetical protein VLE53_06720 [Gemmatimonadaceae bacterium]|nr:hypothetical protein [Gemmatimonadaceae bacterium]